MAKEKPKGNTTKELKKLREVTDRHGLVDLNFCSAAQLKKKGIRRIVNDKTRSATYERIK